MNERTRPQNAEVYTKTEQNTHTHTYTYASICVSADVPGAAAKGWGVAVQHLQLSTRQPDLDVEFITGLD